MRHSTEANGLRSADYAAHNWYRFVLSFPPHLVRDCLQRFNVVPGQRVLDPFCGTGTTLVECRKQNIEAVGVEAAPMAHFASRVKTDWSPDADRFVAYACRIAQAAEKRINTQAALNSESKYIVSNGLLSLPDEKQSLLLTDSISPLPLHKTLVLLELIERYEGSCCSDHARLALAKIMAAQIGNLRFGPEVGVGTIKRDVDVVSLWLNKVYAMAEDLRGLRLLPHAPSTLYQADARRIAQTIEPHSIDAVITSPPYPNEKDYTRTTRMETVLLGFAESKCDLQTIKRGLLRSNTRNIYKGDDDDAWIAEHPEILDLAAEIEARRIALGKTSGFERLYARVTLLYFGGMARHLAELRGVLRPGARLAYVVGDQASYLRVMIRTGQHLANIARSLGYELTGTELFRTRFSTVTKEELREEIVLLRWPGDGRRHG